MFLFPRRITAMVCMSLALAGCGGGDSSAVGASTSFTGKFVDAAVAGMAYRCGSSTVTTGLTTATGEYTCTTGQPVAFYVGDILIGSVSSAMAVVTPLDLVGASASPTNARVMNIVRFLMSISSTNPTTGTITIDPAVATAAAGQTADFAVGSTVLDTLISTIKPGATVYTTAQATTHVAASITGLFAGNYSGTYGGSSNGNWSIAIDANGVASGTSDAGAITGTMATTLSTGSTYGFSGTAGSVPWTGTLNISTKIFSGTWNDGAGGTGTFTGKVASPSPVVPTVATPAFTGFSPASGAAGAAVAITGTDLTAVTQVLFTGPSPSTAFVAGVISAKTATSITTAVPSTLAAGSYTVSVVYPGGEAAATGAFTVSSGGTSSPAPATPVGTQTGGSRQGVAVSMAVGSAPSPFDSIHYYSGATVFAGSGTIGTADGTALTAAFSAPSFMTTDGVNLYVTDGEAVRKISIATADVTSYTGFARPNGITTDGTSIFTVNAGGQVQQINISSGTVSTLTLTGTLFQGSSLGITVVGDKLYCITGAGGTGIQVVDVGSTATRGAVTNFALGDVTGMLGNKLGGSARTFDSLIAITTDGTHLYVVRAGNLNSNPAIDKIVIATGNVTTLAGGGASVDATADSASGVLATFKRPGAITSDGTSLFVIDRVVGGGIRTINLQTTAVTGAGVGFGNFSNLGGPNLPTFINSAGITTDGKHVYAVDSVSGSSGTPKILRLQ
ncbi:MAG: hypothetical protein RLZ68_1384 [Pseudomonadota bacterium]